MITLKGMEVTYLVLLVGVAGLWAMAMQAYAQVPRKNTHISVSTSTMKYWATGTELDIAEFFVVKYRTQAVVSGYYQAAKNLRKQGVPLEVAMMILFGERRDHAA